MCGGGDGVAGGRGGYVCSMAVMSVCGRVVSFHGVVLVAQNESETIRLQAEGERSSRGDPKVISDQVIRPEFSPAALPWHRSLSQSQSVWPDMLGLGHSARGTGHILVGEVQCSRKCQIMCTIL